MRKNRVHHFIIICCCALWIQTPNHQAADAVSVNEMRVENGAAVLGWEGDGESHYVVESSASLSAPIWRPAFKESAWPSAETTFNESVAVPARSRFYRVVTVAAPDRGRLESSELVQSLTATQINILFLANNIPLTAENGARLFKVIYETVSAHGRSTLASGLVAIPSGVAEPLPLVSYQHGTILEKEEAPSALSDESALGIALAATGYVAALPDYLGLGQSEGFHPYHHAATEASAVIDMMRAARQLAVQEQIELNGQVFLTGYSQGGHATMAAAREIESMHLDEFDITAVAPMAGAYDLSGATMDDILSDRPQPNPYYLAYLLFAYQEVYGLWMDPSDFLAEPYDELLPPLFDGGTGASELNDVLPADPTDIIRPEILAAMEADADHWLRVVLRHNDVYDWTPSFPVRLYHCQGDQDVLFANSEVALAAFQANGAVNVELVDPFPLANHGTCAGFSSLDAKAWFDFLRE